MDCSNKSWTVLQFERTASEIRSCLSEIMCTQAPLYCSSATILTKPSASLRRLAIRRQGKVPILSLCLLLAASCSVKPTTATSGREIGRNLIVVDSRFPPGCSHATIPCRATTWANICSIHIPDGITLEYLFPIVHWYECPCPSWRAPNLETTPLGLRPRLTITSLQAKRLGFLPRWQAYIRFSNALTFFLRFHPSA